MKHRTKYILQSALFLLCIFSFSALCIFFPDKAQSEAERRPLKQFPALTVSSITSGRFMSDFEAYALDQFPMRDAFRKAKALTSTKLLAQTDNNGLYEQDGVLCKMEYPMDEDSIAHASQRFRAIYDSYLRDKNVNVYMSVIPDKNAFLAESSGHLSMDYEALYSEMAQQNDFAEFIDIAPTLSIEDYYATDTHWRQEAIVDTAEVLAASMGAEISGKYTTNTLDAPFYGVYAGQYALPTEPDRLCYLTNDTIESYRVYDHENSRAIPVYDPAKADGSDPYEVFLSGPLSLITIENPAADTAKELIVFRDSFGSSIAPLLAEGYRKVTLVDIRYLPSAVLGEYIDFEGQDVLFLYSTLVLNNSSTMK
ncbi:MAG: hypothetical protein E7464_06320 [Ruminococcaceae bacterium]|nr:hypothetical protein [Oscillospiraceae bacterium]